MELVCIDYLKLEKSKGGYEDVLIIADNFTCYARAISTRDQTACTTACTLLENFFIDYGFLLRLHSDNAQNFESMFIWHLCKMAGIKKSRYTQYHPWLMSKSRDLTRPWYGCWGPWIRHWRLTGSPLYYPWYMLSMVQDMTQQGFRLAMASIVMDILWPGHKTRNSCTLDREIRCFTLCKKFVILHKLSYTGPTSCYLTLVVLGIT